MEAIQTADVSHTVPDGCGDFSLADEPRLVSIVEIIDALTGAGRAFGGACWL